MSETLSLSEQVLTKVATAGEVLSGAVQRWQQRRLFREAGYADTLVNHYSELKDTEVVVHDFMGARVVDVTRYNDNAVGTRTSVTVTYEENFGGVDYVSAIQQQQFGLQAWGGTREYRAGAGRNTLRAQEVTEALRIAHSCQPPADVR